MTSTKVSTLGLVVLLIATVALLSCTGKQTAVKDSDTGDDEDAIVDANIKRNVKPLADDEVAVIETTEYGNIVIELYPNIAPLMVERFKKLAREGFYNGTTFHRINAASGLIQGGDPLSKDSDPANDGTGDSPYANVPGEFSDIPFARGTLGAARKAASQAFAGMPGLTEAQARDTANCQFFITLKGVSEFDGDYTVFGRVISGIGNAEIIAGAPVQTGTERPADKMLIKSITLQPRSDFGSGS